MQPPRIAAWAVIMVLVLNSGTGAAELVPKMLPGVKERLDRLAGFLKSRPDAAGMAEIRQGLLAPSQTARGLAAILLKKYGEKDSDRHLLEQFSVNDYGARSKGKYNMISPEEMVLMLKEIEAEADRQGHPVPALVVFSVLRDKNLWMPDPAGNGQKISLARFFRSAYFSSVFGPEEAVKIANWIDTTTLRRFEGK